MTDLALPARFRVATAPVAPNPGDLARPYFMGKVPIEEQYRPYWGRSLDLTNIESAIRQANFGLMSRLTDLSRETITLDGDVSAFLQKRLNRVAALDWDCIPATGTGLDEGRAKERAAEVRENLQMIPNFRDRIMDLAWGNFDGRAASELEWLRRGRKWNVRNLHWIHPRRLSFGPDRDLRVIDPQRQTGNFADVGFPLEFVPYKFVTFCPRLFGDYQEREGLAPRTLYWSFFKRLGTREQLELMEIFGKPWRIMTPKFGQNNVLTPGMQNVDAYEKAFLALQMLGFHNTARMPPGVEVQIVQPQEGAGAVHNDVVKACRDVLSKLFLGGVATTDAISTGLGSTIGDIHLTEEDLIIAGDARRIAECLEDKLTDAIVVANYGPSEVVYAPKFVIRTDPPTDRAAEGNRIKAAIDVGLRVAEEEARERLGFRAVRADEAYISRIQREAPPGQIPPPPAPETVWPVGNSPPPGEIPDLPDVVLNTPDDRGEPIPEDGGAAQSTPPARGAPGLAPPTPEPGALPAAPGDLPAAASSAAADDEPSEAAQLAAQMTELGCVTCEHGKKNRCPLCGVERSRRVEMGDDGVHVFPVAWKPIGGKAAASPAPAADGTCPECGAELGTNIDCPTCLQDDSSSPMDDADDEPGEVLTTTTRARTARRLERLLALAPPNEGGNHWHTLERHNHATAIDGTHTHWFQLPDDTLVETAGGGAHQHRWEESGDRDYPRRWIYGGAHLHSLELDGAPLRTQVDGYHDHELQVSATTQSGAHSHCLVLADGATIESLRSTELAEILEGERLAMPVTYRYRQRRRLTGVGLLSASVLFAAQPETVNGSPDDLVERGVKAFVAESAALGEAIADRIEGKTSGRAIRKAVDLAAKAWDRKRFADVLEPELLHGQMLGALDAAWEAANGTKVAPETFSDLYRDALLLKRSDPGSASDPAFSKRPQVDAGEAFISKDVVTRDVFDRMTDAAKQRAFTVANAATEEIARAVKRELVRQIATGAELADFKKHALARLSSAGWTPLNASHVETVFRTNVMTAYNSGRFRQMTQPAVVALRPYWQILGVGDGPPRERATHAKANNLVLLATDAFWRKAYPPFGYNCRHRIRSLSRAQGESIGVTDGATIQDLPDPGFASGVSSLMGAPALPTEIPAAPEPGTALGETQVQAHVAERGGTIDADGAREIGKVLGKVQTSDLDAFMGHAEFEKLGGTRTVSVTSGKNLVRFVVEAETENGERANLERTFRKQGKKLVVHHDRLLLSEGLQAKGVGKRILSAQVAAYERLGVDAIELDASWIGTYYWPKIGFGIPAADLAAVVEDFVGHLYQLGFSEEAAAAMTKGIKSVRDIAITVAGEERVGKDYLISKGYLPNLSMPLEPGNPQLAIMKRELGL